MRWLDKLLGRNKEIQETYSPDLVDDPELEAMIQTTFEVRNAFYSKLGTVDSDAIAPLINPSFMGGPRWPALRQAWRVIRRSDSIIIVSDGLSDPFEDEKIPLGYRVEVCAEFFGEIEVIPGSWLFDLVYQVSQNVAYHGGFEQLIDQYETVSTVLSISGAPAIFKNDNDEVGVIIGFPASNIPSEFNTPFGSVKMLTITLLHPLELAYIESSEDMEVRRKEIVDKLKSTKTAHLCVNERASIV